MKTKYAVIIQCDIACRRCSGFACTNTFYNREGAFKDYDADTKYIAFTCGGCCGKGIAAKLEQLSKQMRKKTDVDMNEIVVHLASCIVTDNHHSDRCPHVDYIKTIIAKKGYKNIVEGSYLSQGAQKKREAGTYHSYK